MRARICAGLVVAALACGDDDSTGTASAGTASTGTASTGTASTGTASTTDTASTGTASTDSASSSGTAGTAATGTSMATSAADLPGLPATLEQWSACVDGGPFSSNPAIEAACLDRCELDAPPGYGSTRLSLCEEPTLGGLQSPLLLFDSREDCEAQRNPRPTNVLFDAQGVADLRCCCGYLRAP